MLILRTKFCAYAHAQVFVFPLARDTLEVYTPLWCSDAKLTEATGTARSTAMIEMLLFFLLGLGGRTERSSWRLVW
jgi:hypothetical protein